MRVKVYSILLLGFLVFGCADASPTPPEKVHGPLPESVKLDSGHILQLGGGPTKAGRSQLKAGETGYFILAFDQPAALTAEGIEIGDVVDRSVFFAVVQPEALAQLEDWDAEGSLRYAGPVPLEAKLSPDLAEEMKSVDPDERLDVMVRILDSLSDTQRSELSRYLTIEYEAKNMPILVVTGSIKSKDISNILSFPVIRFVDLNTGIKLK